MSIILQKYQFLIKTCLFGVCFLQTGLSLDLFHKFNPVKVSYNHENDNNLCLFVNAVSQDTLVPDLQKLTCYLISGSFLIPKNAEKHVLKLRKLGFQKTYKYNFPNSEYYAVVIDSFSNLDSAKFLIENLTIYKLEYFTKCL